MVQVINVNFTNRTNALIAAIRIEAERLAGDLAEALRDTASITMEQNYPETEERDTLNQGFSMGGNAGGTMVGSDENGRMVTFTPLYKLIRDSAVEPNPSPKVGMAEYFSCSAPDINEGSHFEYIRKKDNQTIKAVPFHNKYIEASEFGGTWTVGARADNPSHILSPEHGVVANLMIKQIAPKEVFRKTEEGTKTKVEEIVARRLGRVVTLG